MSVCLLITFVSPAKTAQPIEMPHWTADSGGSRNQALDGRLGWVKEPGIR